MFLTWARAFENRKLNRWFFYVSTLQFLIYHPANYNFFFYSEPQRHQERPWTFTQISSLVGSVDFTSSREQIYRLTGRVKFSLISIDKVSVFIFIIFSLVNSNFTAFKTVQNQSAVYFLYFIILIEYNTKYKLERQFYLCGNFVF